MRQTFRDPEGTSLTWPQRERYATDTTQIVPESLCCAS